MRPWTAELTGGNFGEAVALQWGHGLAAVDGAYARLPSYASPALQWGHGLAAVDGCRCRR